MHPPGEHQFCPVGHHKRVSQHNSLSSTKLAIGNYRNKQHKRYGCQLRSSQPNQKLLDSSEFLTESAFTRTFTKERTSHHEIFCFLCLPSRISWLDVLLGIGNSIGAEGAPSNNEDFEERPKAGKSWSQGKSRFLRCFLEVQTEC